MKRLLASALLWLAAGMGPLAFAQPGVHRLDDSLSHTEPPNLQMQWRPHSGPDAGDGMEAWVRVRVHIDTRDWSGRRGRVYMVLPSDQPPAVEAVWSSAGALRAGRLVSGERALVFSGALPAEALQDMLSVRLRTGPDWFSQSRRLNFHFEFEPD
ncbi:MAG TPA: hypothetical protein PKC60_13700 [Hydrogenophaga sp.]|uniref:hypothetical protein n=1 Tax=Hydrogenophaga sp. TaxID=1904254 RepID=UPI002CAA436F|nr:hypothetical protein [Hydrogenophaga sp.]HMN94280.1 hypothetical protein [Hydrogenophaga sp.]HMP11008.1 hypothetical protein [Hydrogenophaga sp.]